MKRLNNIGLTDTGIMQTEILSDAHINWRSNFSSYSPTTPFYNFHQYISANLPNINNLHYWDQVGSGLFNDLLTSNSLMQFASPTALELPNAAGLLDVNLVRAMDSADFAFAKGSTKGGPGGEKGLARGKGKGDTDLSSPDDSTNGGAGGDESITNPAEVPDTGTQAKTYLSGPSDGAGFNILLEFQGTWSDSLYNIFVAAADKLTNLILGDLPDMNLGGRVIDDILISAQLITIDGSGGILGQAGPTSIRSETYLPVTGLMMFDSADASIYESQGLFDEIVLHEMAHTLGFGTVWNYLGLVSDESVYTGRQANAEYFRLGGTGAGIPVETDYGAGTAGAHWDEATFKGELMTGVINGTNYFSGMSAAAFADLGYTLSNYSQLDWIHYSYAIA